jgi:acyl-CoA synthetase (AMP-forming)/AMP-acid ligase II
VADAALIGLSHPVLGEVPAAAIQLRPGAAVSEGELKEFAAARLAAFKVPVSLRLSEQALPRNDAGKLMKQDLRRAFAP